MNILHKLDDIKEKRVLFFDLDDTLIRTSSGKVLAEDVTDFRIDKSMLDAIRKLANLRWVFIVCNQPSIPQSVSKEDFEAKFAAVMTFMQHYINVGKTSAEKIKVDGLYCAAKGYNSKNRKPNTGMLERCIKSIDTTISKSEMAFCGEASGIHNEKRDDFSDSDLRTARNFEIDYIDFEDFRSL